jgi:DNA-directed RNA polymerases I, II, and III subunit RPABC2
MDLETQRYLLTILYTMSDYEDSASDSDNEDVVFDTKGGKGKLAKKKKEEEPEHSDDDISIHSDEEEEDDIEVEDSDLGSEPDMEEMGELGNRGPAGSIHSSFLNMDYEEEEEDANYLQKFDEGIKQDIIAEHHRELQVHNYNEVLALSRVVKDETGKIIDPLHKTLPFLTKYEKARILGERAKQINAGAEPFVAVEPEMIDGYLIALKELEEKKIPFLIKRPLPDGGCEYWKLKDLELL